jgi:hypothetical protein
MFHGIFQSINDASPPACTRRRKIIELATLAVRCYPRCVILIGQKRRIGNGIAVIMPAARCASRCCASGCLLLWTAHRAK